VQHFRLAFYWEEPDESKISDIDFCLDGLESDGVTVCSSCFQGQFDYSVNNAAHLASWDIPSCASYIRVRISAFGIPSGQSRLIYYSDLYDNESSF
jgi:hypothetical protein